MKSMKSLTKRTKAETEQLYRRLLAEQAESRLSMRTFAAERGVPAGTLSFWKHELRKRDARTKRSGPALGTRFVPVSIVGAVAAEPAPPASPGIYEVVLGENRVLRLPADFDAARVAALVRALGSC